MSTFRPVHGAGLAGAAIAAFGVTLAASPAQATHTPSAPTNYVSVVAATGTDKVAYARTTAETGWRNLGGQLSGPAAVVKAANGRTYYVGRGTNASLYVRTDTTNWTRLASTTYCGNPAATSDATYLYVACRGGNGALYSGKALLSASAPVITAWANLGGKLATDPAMAYDHLEGVIYYAVGPRYSEDGDSANLYANYGGSGWEREWMDCAGRPAAAIAEGERDLGVLWTACLQANGSVAYQYFGDFAPHIREGIINGTATGAPSIALSPKGDTARIYVQGTNGAAYMSTLTMTGTTSLRLIGGTFAGGVGAAGLG